MSTMAETVPPETMTAESPVLRLRHSQSSLARLVERVSLTSNPFLVVSPEAIARWTEIEPANWAMVQAWLRQHGVALIVI